MLTLAALFYHGARSRARGSDSVDTVLRHASMPPSLMSAHQMPTYF